LTQLHKSGQAGATNEVHVTPAMIAAGVAVLRDSGLFEHPGLIDASLVREVLGVALAARKVGIHVDG
jgi:hypothetical protein